MPTDRPLADLTAELTTMLGSADPASATDRLPDAGHLGRPRGLRRPARRARRRHGRRARVGLGETGTDSVFRRSFSALVLAECIERDNAEPLLPGGKVLEWGDRIAGWLCASATCAASCPGKGWAHAVAHGADALGALADSPHLGLHELTVLLDVIADRVLLAGRPACSPAASPTGWRGATMAVLRRNAGAAAGPRAVGRPARGRRRRPRADDDRDPFLTTGNARGLPAGAAPPAGARARAARRPRRPAAGARATRCAPPTPHYLGARR